MVWTMWPRQVQVTLFTTGITTAVLCVYQGSMQQDVQCVRRESTCQGKVVDTQLVGKHCSGHEIRNLQCHGCPVPILTLHQVPHLRQRPRGSINTGTNTSIWLHKMHINTYSILVYLEINNELSSIFHLRLQACYANNMWKQCIQYDTAKVSMKDSKVWKVCQLTTEDEVGEVEGCTCCKLAIFECPWISNYITTVVALVKLSYWRRRHVLITGEMPYLLSLSTSQLVQNTQQTSQYHLTKSEKKMNYKCSKFVKTLARPVRASVFTNFEHGSS